MKAALSNLYGSKVPGLGAAVDGHRWKDKYKEKALEVGFDLSSDPAQWSSDLVARLWVSISVCSVLNCLQLSPWLGI